MFLNNLIRQNPRFAETVIELHQRGDIPPDTYVLDIDTIAENARLITAESHRLGMQVVAMTKQFGRNPVALSALRENGVDAFVAVDVGGARSIQAAGQPLGNVGHLVQIPRNDALEVASMAPWNWTVFSDHKAREAAEAAHGLGREQDLLARIFGPEDLVVPSHAGGFALAAVESLVDRWSTLEGGRFAGVSSYPALVFDRVRHVVEPSPNLRTLSDAARRLIKLGLEPVVNGPGETSTNVLSLLADAGVTQVEPGHGFTATGAFHAFANLPERPAMLYVSEVSHLDGDFAFVYGGGLYLCVGSVDYQLQAIVGRDLANAVNKRVPAHIGQNHQVIDFYGVLDQDESRSLEPGDTALFCFRAQAFYVRSHIAPVVGIHSGTARVEGIYTAEGVRVS